ncbi:MAG: 6-carboxytetrahydropterin synthase [Chitinophagaceae bacterium]|jgi:6-pyruvoyltetrahydropterin/6-carboxytetrahydropterin synthase|nr:6-carboxytetrahydropterin synthase [Chitinophagaceae bacterium]
MEQKVAVFRKEHFNAAHKLFCADWSDAENKRVFGACSNPNYHGHNYDLIVKVVGVPDPITGFVINTKDLSKIVAEEVISRFDHKNLNLDTELFKNLNPSAENIAIVIYNLLRPRIAEQLALKIRLYETERNFVDYPA